MKFHELAELFPLIDGPEFDALVLDIKTNGLREPIWVYKREILDGRNRFLACEKAGVKAVTQKYEGDDPLGFVISRNVHRRHLSESQRAMIAARITTSTWGGDRKADQDANLHLDNSKVSKELRVSKRSIATARKVVDKGSKALQKAVDSGEIAVSKAATVLDLPKSEQLAAAEATKQAAPKSIEVTPTYDFTDYEPEDDDEYRRQVDAVMLADDKLSAMREELKQAYREMQGLKASSNHYQSEAGQAVRLVKARDREIEKLKKELATAKTENERLQERIAIMEAA